MNELTENQTQEVQSEPQYESPDIGDMLNGTTQESGEAVESVGAESMEPEVVETTEGEVTQAQAQPTPAAVTAPETVQKPAIQMTPEIQALIDEQISNRTKGILGALQGERSRRRELEQQLGVAMPVDEVQSVTSRQDQRFLALSENAARRHYKDFDSAYALFLEEIGNNPSLRDTVLNSDDPGEAAYQAGLQVKLVRELGQDVLGNPYKLLEKGEQRGYEKAKAELMKEYEAKLSARATEKHLTPTDISKARSAGSTSVPYRTPSLSEVLKKAVR